MNVFRKLLIKHSILPYKVVKLDTELLVKHYINGYIDI